jgi:AmiR/NasT family two-component response regulator
MGDDRMTTDIAPLVTAGEGVDGPHREALDAPADVLDRVVELGDEVRQLKEALDSNRRIGMAMGLVMGQLQISDDEAFDALRRISQNTNRKLRDVADDIIYHRRL